MLAFNSFFWWTHDHVMIYGPNSCDRRGLITFVIVDSIPVAVCIQSMPVPLPSDKTAPRIVYFYNYAMQCPTVFAHVQCNLPFLTSYMFIFPQDTWDNFGMNVQQSRKVRSPLKDVTAATYLKFMSIIPFFFSFSTWGLVRRQNNTRFSHIPIRLFTFSLICNLLFNILCNILEPIIL